MNGLLLFLLLLIGTIILSIVFMTFDVPKIITVLIWIPVGCILIDTIGVFFGIILLIILISIMIAH